MAVELTSEQMSMAQHGININILSENLYNKECSIYGQKFDCVISWAVIEYVECPDSFIDLMNMRYKV